MNFRMAYVLSATGLIISLFLCLAASAKADNNTTIGLIVSPPVVEEIINPGETKAGIIKVSNPTAQDLNVTVSIQNFKARGEEGGQEFIEDDDTEHSIASWLSVEGGFIIKPGETIESNYAISIPQNAEPGGHYGVVFYNSIPNKAVDASANASMVPKVGTLFIIQVPGDLKYDAAVKEFDSKKVFWQRNIEALLITRIENLGNVHFKPAGTIKVKNTLGKEVGALVFNDKNGNVLPQSVRKFENTFNKKNNFGRYTASLDLTFGENGVLTETIAFWVLPWIEIVVTLLILGVIFYIFRHVQLRRGGSGTGKSAPIPPSTPSSAGNVSTTTDPNVSNGNT